MGLQEASSGVALLRGRTQLTPDLGFAKAKYAFKSAVLLETPALPV
jgi:hypothetical protein